jgi:exonuclease VII small subunit
MNEYLCKILDSARNSLNILLTDAEKRNYNPPIPSEAIAELEYIISELERILE